MATGPTFSGPSGASQRVSLSRKHLNAPLRLHSRAAKTTHSRPWVSDGWEGGWSIRSPGCHRGSHTSQAADLPKDLNNFWTARQENPVLEFLPRCGPRIYSPKASLMKFSGHHPEFPDPPPLLSKRHAASLFDQVLVKYRRGFIHGCPSHTAVQFRKHLAHAPIQDRHHLVDLLR